MTGSKAGTNPRNSLKKGDSAKWQILFSEHRMFRLVPKARKRLRHSRNICSDEVFRNTPNGKRLGPEQNNSPP
jgi:hypothetical protein